MRRSCTWITAERLREPGQARPQHKQAGLASPISEALAECALHPSIPCPHVLAVRMEGRWEAEEGSGA